MSDVPFRSGVALAADIRARRIGCRELLDLYLQRIELQRIERYNPALDAIIVTDIGGAPMRRMQRSSAARSGGRCMACR